jgi:hypothetical protein
MTVADIEFATPLRRASVATVLNANDHDHFVVSGEERFRRACPPWVDLTFVADHDIAETLTAMLDDGSVDAVVFASNSLITAAARRSIAQEDFKRRWAEDGPNCDVGVVVLHQYLSPQTVLKLDFLGSAEFSLIGEPPRRVASTDIRFIPDWLFTTETPYQERAKRFEALSIGYGKRRDSLWTRAEPRYPTQWERLAWEQDRESLISTCNVGERMVIASRVPIDLMDNTELLKSLIAWSLRPRGCLVVEASRTSGSTAFTPALASAIERGRFVHRLSPAHAIEIDPAKAPYCFFEELIVAPEWPVQDIAALDERTVLRKLEQGGALVVTFTGPGGNPVTVRLEGQPQYALRANSLASWFLMRLDAFKGDLWATRGLAEAVVATRNAFEDERLIPQALREDFVRRHIAGTLLDRVRDDNVDDNVLATVATHAALQGLGVQGHEGLREWVATHLDREPTSAVAQALILVPELRTEKRLRRVLEAAKGCTPTDDDARLLKAYAAVLFADKEPELLRAAAGQASLGLGVQAELLRAMVRTWVQATDEIVGLAALVRERIDRLAEREGALEAVCVGNAALIELARRQGIGPTVGIRGRPRELDARTIEDTELVRMREDAVRDAERYRRVGRQAATALVGLLILITVAALVTIFVGYGGALGDKFGVASAVFGAMSGLIGYVAARARRAGLLPWPGNGV